MPIRPFLNGEEFDPETVRILGVAFEQTCIALRIGHCDDYVKQAIANKIMELGKIGERSLDRLCERALEDICQPQAGIGAEGNPASAMACCQTPGFLLPLPVSVQHTR